MASDTVEALVEQARSGDRSALTRLLLRFQDFAVACASARLGDLELARDAAQEALVDATLHLDQLREPAAFSGWLRRVVAKHCDRLVRGKRPPVSSLERVAEPVDPAPSASTALDRGIEHARLRATLERLPASDRELLALRYLGGQTEREIASLLELPASTVKKRLHTARRRLKEHLMATLQRDLDALRPSRDPRFRATVELFVAVRSGDQDGVRAVLDRHPDLVNAEECWELEESLDRDLPVPTRATPLIRAAERGDVALVELLLTRGADPDRDCGCQGGETALWAATVTGRREVAARLLRAGAAPDATAFAGHTPLHVAAIRGFDELAALLLGHGADPGRRSHDGRTPLDWARRKGHAAIVRRLAPRATSGLSARPAQPSPVAFATGIKALDLFAPLRPGFRVRVHGGAGVGQSVLLAELSLRAHEQGFAVVWASWARRDWEEGEVEELLAETGIGRFVQLLRSATQDPEPRRRALAARALEVAEGEASSGRRVLLVLLRAEGHQADVEALPLPSGSGAAITTLDLAPWRNAARAVAAELSPPFDAQIVLDPALARSRHFPAIDPFTSRSRALVPEEVGERRVAVAAKVRGLLARHRELTAQGDGEPSPEEQALVTRADRVRAYLTQPFFCAEAFHGRPGSFVAPDRAVEDLEALLGGSDAGLSPQRFLYRGGLDEIRAAGG